MGAFEDTITRIVALAITLRGMTLGQLRDYPATASSIFLATALVL
ncbi:hypothetical protein [Marinobacter sp. ATCH36]|nr:hypothetical protein [Marinobacter sp. ATCH36]